MSDYSELPGDGSSPPLRVVYGDDSINVSTVAMAEETDGGDDDPTPAEMDSMLLGFRPAIRFSARLSA